MFFKELTSFTFILLLFFKPITCHAFSEEKELLSLKDNSLKSLIILEQPKIISNFEVVTPNNKKIQLDLNKKFLLINFWATWCAPCREEMPSFSNLQKIFNKDDFQVITVASGRNNLKKIEEFYNNLKIQNLPLHRDPKGKTSIENNVFGLPTTLIIQNGYEVARLIGPADWDNEFIVKYITQVLNSN